MTKAEMIAKMDEIMAAENETAEDCEIWYEDLPEKSMECVMAWARENLGDVRSMDVSFVEECAIASNIRYKSENDEFIAQMLEGAKKRKRLIRIGLENEDLDEMSTFGVIDYLERKYGKRVWSMKMEWESYDDGDIIVRDLVLGGKLDCEDDD